MQDPVFHMGKGPLPGEMHQFFGQEPCAVGVCAYLGKDDAVGAGHRPQHVAVARGVDLNKMVAELFGKKTGLSGGRHTHLYDANVNFFSSGIIAEGMGPGAGMALARKMQGKPGIAAAFVGDGAANQGAFHEVLNMVGLWKLPFICVIEHNKYGVSVSKKDPTAIDRNSDRASSHALAGEYVGGNDPDLIFAAAGRAVERARRGEGKTILELETERLHGHFIGDSGAYRPEAERKAMQHLIPAYCQRLLAENAVSPADMAALEAKVPTQVDEAMRFGRESAYPDASDALQRLYA